MLPIVMFGTGSWPDVELLPRAYGQVLDDFSDGDFTSDPVWTGDTEAWTVAFVDGNFALMTAGAAGADTVHLAVPSGVSYGDWSFDFAHRGVNLSTFNGARVFVCSQGPDVETMPAGYYVQIGTNNSDAVSFWRVDGSWSSRRELARSEAPLASGDSSRLHVSITRDASSAWTVSVNGSVVEQSVDAAHEACTHLAIWVKHTEAGRSSFSFDTFTTDALAPAPSDPDHPPPAPRDVVVNELHVDPAPSGSEFVELLNRGGTPVDLSALTIRDERAAPIRLTPGPTVLEPNGYAVIVQNGPSFEDQFRAISYVTPSAWPTLNNDGDVLIVEADGVVIDSVSYDADAVVPDRSLERIDPDAPSDRFNFTPSADPFGATPGVRNSRYQRDVEGPRLLFVHESGEGQIDLTFDEPIRIDSTPAAFVRHGDTNAEKILELEPGVLRSVFATTHDEPLIHVRAVVDRSGNRSEQLTASIAFRPDPLDIVVNEILYEPLADDLDGVPDQVEYIELLNRSGRLLHADGLFRTRDAGEDGDADTARVDGHAITIEPGGLLVLSSVPTDAPEAWVAAPSLNLRNAGDRIRLHSPYGVVLEDLSYDPSWHHPDVLDTRGIALERIDPDGPGGDPSNWTSSASSEGGTPGRPNSVRLRISSVPSRGGLHVHPNPFSPDRDGFEDVAKITCLLPADLSRVRVRIFDVAGDRVRELIPAALVAGSAEFLWNGLDDAGRRLPAGIYIALVEGFDARNSVSETYKAPIVLARRF